jgi:hypothetical protein
MVKKIRIVMFLWLMTNSLFGQNLISYITIDNKEAYIGQPAALTVSVYTSTWFTSGIDIGNIQIDGALTVFFRSLSNSQDFNGQRHAGVNFYYNIFPTQEGEITIPSLSINIESPKPGDYKGIKRTITTKPKTFNVKSIPYGYDPNNWLVATSLNVSEKWSSSTSEVKVGDVIQRTINRSAAGTLSEFIPATNWDSINGISIYPKRPQLNTTKSKTAVSSNRSETVSYLFEKEGKFILPSVEYSYWNSQAKKFYKKQIDSIVISVQPNADLAMLASIKNSLQKEQIEEIEVEEKPLLIFGLTPKSFLQYLVIALVVLFLLFIILKRVISSTKIKYNNYLKSETYVFYKVKKAIAKKDYFLFLEVSPSWLHKLKSGTNSLGDFVRENGSKELQKVLSHIDEMTFSMQKTVEDQSYKLLLKELNRMRNNYFKKQSKKQKLTVKKSKWLNPTATDSF